MTNTTPKRILFITLGDRLFEYPATRVRGGVEKVEVDQLQALERLGLDFTIACPGDSIVGEQYAHFKTKVLSRDTTGVKRPCPYLNEIAKSGLMESHDVVLYNCVPPVRHTASIYKWLGEYAHKFRLISHEPDVYFRGCHLVYGRISLLKFVASHGGKTAAVQVDGPEIWAEVEQDIRTGRKFKVHQERYVKAFDDAGDELFTDFYEVMVVDDDFVPVEQLGKGTRVNFTSRPAAYKGFYLACQAATLAGQEEHFLGNTCTPGPGQEIKDWAKAADYHWLFRLDQAHSAIMADLAKAKVFLQPTKSESAGGIVAFEAAAHGVPVITTTDTGRRYLEPYGLYLNVERSEKAVAQAIQEAPVFDAEERQAIARRVRDDFSHDKYAQNLLSFLSS